MLISEIPLGDTVLCKVVGTYETDVFEVTMLGFSDNRLAVYLKTVYYPGEEGCCYGWKSVDYVDKTWQVFDTFEESTHGIT